MLLSIIYHRVMPIDSQASGEKYDLKHLSALISLIIFNIYKEYSGDSDRLEGISTHICATRDTIDTRITTDFI